MCAGYVTVAMKYELRLKAMATPMMEAWYEMQSQIMKWNSMKSVAQLLIMHDQIETLKMPKEAKQNTQITAKD